LLHKGVEGTLPGCAAAAENGFGGGRSGCGAGVQGISAKLRRVVVVFVCGSARSGYFGFGFIVG
jgi:hypothetical protein